jgi:hypothetical protein
VFEIRIRDPGSETGIRDPGTGKTLSRISDPGVKKALDHGSGTATLATRPIVDVFFSHIGFIIFRMGHEKPTEEALSTANSEASELKEKGNEAYKNDNLDDALVFYTQGNFFCFESVIGSILLGPCES